jgi:ribonuclease HII
VAEIDEHNILQATMLAMKRAVEGLTITPERVLVDGNRCPALAYRVHAVIKGDQLVPAISAASILAKVARDREMLKLHALYPDYGFDSHKGYPTRVHLAALQRHGVTPEHRRSYGPVRRVLEQTED